MISTLAHFISNLNDHRTNSDFHSLANRFAICVRMPSAGNSHADGAEPRTNNPKCRLPWAVCTTAGSGLQQFRFISTLASETVIAYFYTRHPPSSLFVGISYFNFYYTILCKCNWTNQQT